MVVAASLGTWLKWSLLCSDSSLGYACIKHAALFAAVPPPRPCGYASQVTPPPPPPPGSLSTHTLAPGPHPITRAGERVVRHPPRARPALHALQGARRGVGVPPARLPARVPPAVRPARVRALRRPLHPLLPRARGPQEALSHLARPGAAVSVDRGDVI